MKIKQFSGFLVLVFYLLGFTNCSDKVDNVVFNTIYEDEINAVKEEALAYMAANRIPGGSIAVSIEGEIVYSEGLGMASLELEVPATRKTKFRIADVSELFTSLIYQLMVEEGSLHPDSSVQHYLPEFPEKNYKISLHHLVNHISGISEPDNVERNRDVLITSIQNGIDDFSNDSLLVPPGSQQIESSYNYNLLGAVMEKATGKSFRRILEDYLTDTLQLENTLIDHPLSVIKNRTDFYDEDIMARIVNAPTRDLNYRAPSEGLLSTSEDLVKLGNSILHSDYIPEAVKTRLFEPVTTNNGRRIIVVNGWAIDSGFGSSIYGKTGNISGGTAALVVIPEYKFVFACAFNVNTPVQNIPVFEIIETFMADDGERNAEDATPSE